MKLLRKKEIKNKFKKFKRNKEIYVILENIQYARNVASIFRTCDAAQVKRLYLTGISHKPPFGKDLKKVSRNKEKSVEWVYFEDTTQAIDHARAKGFKVFAVDLTDESKSSYVLPELLKETEKICFVFGNEVHGITKKVLERCNESITIPMFGRGASLSVGVSVGIVLYSF